MNIFIILMIPTKAEHRSVPIENRAGRDHVILDRIDAILPKPCCKHCKHSILQSDIGKINYN